MIPIILNTAGASDCPQQHYFVVEDTEELKDLLIRVGGTLNPRLVATTLKDAQNFPDLVSKNRTIRYGKMRICDDIINNRSRSNEGHAAGIFPPAPGSDTGPRCYEAGTITDTGNVRLCTQCSSTRDLGAEFYPRYVNEVICGPNINTPSSPVCFKGEGACVQRQQSYTFFKNIGSSAYETFNVNINVCCECELKNGSPFTAHL